MEILGIDIGGSGIKGAIVDTVKGEMLTDRNRIDTPQPPVPKDMLEVIREIQASFSWDGIIGCGFPAAVRHEIIKTASNIDNQWIGMNAAEEIERITGCKTHLVNDVDAAGYAEMAFGAGKGEKGAVIMAAFGTGIGTALFSEGVLYPNTELGHLMLNGQIAEHFAASSIKDKEDLTLDEFGKRMNDYLNRLEALFWPDLMIIGGGISKKYEEYAHHIDVEARVEPATMRNKAGIIGAALAAYHEFIEIRHHSV